MVFTNFKLGTKKLSDFGAVIHNGDGQGRVLSLPELAQRTNDIPNKDGIIYSGTNAKVRTWTEYIYIENLNFDFTQFKSWLYNDGEEQTFNYDGDTSNRAIDVVCTNISNLEVYNEKQFKCEVEFTAYNPYWYLPFETNLVRTNVATNTIIDVNQNGNVKGEPLIYITPASSSTIVKFSMNDLEVTLSALDSTKKYLVNCETEEVFEIGGTMVACMNKYVSNEWHDFPKLKPYFANKFKVLQGTISRLEIDYNSKFI